MEYPTSFTKTVESIVEQVRRAPPQTAREELYGTVSAILSRYTYERRPPPYGDRRKLSLELTLKVLYEEAPSYHYLEDIQGIVSTEANKSPSLKTVEKCLREGEAWLWVDRIDAPKKERSGPYNSYKFGLTEEGRRYVELYILNLDPRKVLNF